MPLVPLDLLGLRVPLLALLGRLGRLVFLEPLEPLREQLALQAQLEQQDPLVWRVQLDSPVQQGSLVVLVLLEQQDQLGHRVPQDQLEFKAFKESQVPLAQVGPLDL